MNAETADAEPRINTLDGKRDSGRQSPLAGQLLQRQKKRRANLKTVAGSLRESARTYMQYVRGEISAAECEIRSRALKRHVEALGVHEQNQLLVDVQGKLDRLEHVQALPYDYGGRQQDAGADAKPAGADAGQQDPGEYPPEPPFDPSGPTIRYG